MTVCPQFLHIRISSNAAELLNDRIILQQATSFGFTEFKSNIPKPLGIQCLFCHEFAPLLCKEAWYNKDATVQLCKKIQSNFHLCLQLSENTERLYVYFQKRAKLAEVAVDTIITELQAIYTSNGDTAEKICAIMLLCGQPAGGTSIIAAKREEFKNKFKKCNIRFYMKDILTQAETITFSEKNINPCCINIEAS